MVTFFQPSPPSPPSFSSQAFDWPIGSLETYLNTNPCVDICNRFPLEWFCYGQLIDWLAPDAGVGLAKAVELYRV